MIEFVWPQTNGEWLAWSSALYLVISGIWTFVAPRRWLSFVGHQAATNHPELLAQLRGPLGGGRIGLGLAVLVLHPQPLLYLALGSMLFFAAIGRLTSIVVDKASTKYNWIALIIDALLAFFPFAYALGYIA
ncbi:MAG: DUF4345 family protein [Rhizobiaceae bacterium]|nr:DUF4345 family protein [Rhizobiaceae bacterium]